ncbi:hypothetical protein TRIUR3_23173 [Triticum urartu]|uniref:Uncharacterized protein n=1 Tax=Triticum urartu TaxID=4572 RepID=M7ZJJ5_TRIUA|nr:hypothetical protein TRIUR3_23173 [Triticum urartu]
MYHYHTTTAPPITHHPQSNTEKRDTDRDPISEQDKACLQEIRELSYDIDDDLDDFMEATVCEKSADLAGLLDKMKAMLGRTKARHQIAKAVDDLKEQVVQVAERHNHKRSKVDPRAPAIVDDASKLVGLDGPKQELIQLLLAGSASESTQQQPHPEGQ